MIKHLPAMQETRVWFLGQEDPLEKEMAIHSSTLAWKITWMEEPDKLQSMGSQRVRHDWATSLHFTSKFARMAHRTQTSTWLMFAVDNNEHYSAAAEWKRGRWVHRCFHTLSGHSTLPAPGCVHQPGSSQIWFKNFFQNLTFNPIWSSRNL